MIGHDSLAYPWLARLIYTAAILGILAMWFWAWLKPRD